MTRWEYKCLRLTHPELAEGLEDKLNALGAEGWELVSLALGERHGYTHDATFLFKRPRA
jgi:hypothetical protein